MVQILTNCSKFLPRLLQAETDSKLNAKKIIVKIFLTNIALASGHKDSKFKIVILEEDFHCTRCNNTWR